MPLSREKLRVYLISRYNEQRRLFIAFLGGVCAKCGSTDQLTIDHIDPAQKSFDVSALWGKKNLDSVLDELRKCQLLCGSCNRDKTASDLSRIGLERHKALYPDGIHHGTMTGWMKKKCICELCSANKWAWHDRRNAARRKPGGKGQYRTRRLAKVAE